MGRRIVLLALAAAATLVVVPFAGAGPAGSGALAPAVAVTPPDEQTHEGSHAATDTGIAFMDALEAFTFVRGGANVLEDGDVDADFLLRHANDIAAGEAAASDWEFRGTHGDLAVIEETRVRYVTLDALADAAATAVRAQTGAAVSAADVQDVDLSAHAGNSGLVHALETAAAAGGALPPVTTTATAADVRHALETREPLIRDRDVAAFLGEDGILLVERAWFVIDRDAFASTVEGAVLGVHEATEAAEARALANVLDAHARVHDALVD